MLFSKKSKKKQKKINVARLSEAISVHNNDIALITYSGECFEPELPITYSINEKLSLTVRDFLSPAAAWEGSYLHIGNSFHLDIYVENIKISSFKFLIDKDPFPGAKTKARPWRCLSSKVRHEMPEQFIDALNKWSYDILAQYHQELESYNKKKEEHDRTQYEEEEQRLQAYR